MTHSRNGASGVPANFDLYLQLDLLHVDLVVLGVRVAVADEGDVPQKERCAWTCGTSRVSKGGQRAGAGRVYRGRGSAVSSDWRASCRWWPAAAAASAACCSRKRVVGCVMSDETGVWRATGGAIPVVFEVVGHPHEELEMVDEVPVFLSHRGPQVSQSLDRRVVEGRQHGHARAEVIHLEQLLRCCYGIVVFWVSCWC